MNAGTSRLRNKALPTIALALMVSAALALQATPASAAASGEWTGDVRLEFTRTDIADHFTGFGPDLSFTVTGTNNIPVPATEVTDVTFGAGSEFDFGTFFQCHESRDTVLTSHLGGRNDLGTQGPSTTLLVQTSLFGYDTETTQVYSGPAPECSNETNVTPNTFQEVRRGEFVELVDVDQEAARGRIVMLDSASPSGTRTETMIFAIHRNCTGFDADGGGRSDCDELDDGTDPSLGTDDLGDVDPTECEGPITSDDVIGTPPTLAAGRVFPAFPNDDAICKAVWVPDLDLGFIPQGIHLVGDGSALVSGYYERGKKDKLEVVRVDLSDGSTVGTFTLDGGGHGGGITVAGDGKVWVAATDKLWMWPSLAALASGTQPIKLGMAKSESFKVSYFADAADETHLWIGSFDTNELLQFQLSTLNIKVGTNVGLREADSTATIVTGAKTQGAEFHDPNLWTSSSITAKSTDPNARVAKSKCGTLQTGLGTRTRFGFAPGIEEITFDDQGFLWFVSEAGAKPYAPQFFPVIAQADTSVILELHEAPDQKCTTGI